MGCVLNACRSCILNSARRPGSINRSAVLLGANRTISRTSVPDDVLIDVDTPTTLSAEPTAPPSMGALLYGVEAWASTASPPLPYLNPGRHEYLHFSDSMAPLSEWSGEEGCWM